MGVIICPEHGKSSIAHVCSHLRVAVVDQAPLPTRSIVEVDLDGDVVLELVFCDGCVAERGLPTPPQRVSGDDDERLYETKFKTEPVCATCFAAAEGLST